MSDKTASEIAQEHENRARHLLNTTDVRADVAAVHASLAVSQRLAALTDAVLKAADDNTLSVPWR